MPFPARITATVVTALAACTACALLTPAQPPPAPAHTTAGRAAAVRAVPGLAALLPVSPARLQDAAVLAARFTAAYTTHLPGQSPRAWLARLSPMATAQLTAALARAAPWQSAAVTAGQVTAEQIRDLTPGSVTVIIGIRQTVATAGGRRTVSMGFAVTLAPSPELAGPCMTSSPPMPGTPDDRPERRPGEIRLVLAAGAALLLVPVLLLAAVTGLVSQQADACAIQPPPPARR